MPAAYFCIKAFSETDFTEDLKAFDVQTLILHGDDDQIVPQASDDDRDGYDHPASSAARLLMRTGLFSALFVAFASLAQCDGNRLLLWLAGLHLRFDV